MRRRFLFGAVGFAVLLLAPVAQPAAAAEPKEPGLVLRIQSLDELLANARYLADLVGRGEEAKQFEGFLRAKAGEKGLEGVDTKRPMAVYGTVGPAGIDSTIVAMLPIADEKAFLGLLENLGVKSEKDSEGIWTVSADSLPVPIYFRFAHKHLYGTVQNKDAIDKANLPAPAVVIGPVEPGVASVSLRIDRIPENLRGLVVEQIKQQMEMAKAAAPNDETRAIFEAQIEMMTNQMTNVLEGGKELALRLDIDRKEGEISLALSLDGKPNSTLATDLKSFGERRSATAGIIAPTSAMNILSNIPLPEKYRNAIYTYADSALAQEVKNQTQPAQQELLRRFAKSLFPALKADALDFAIDFRGPTRDGKFALIGGLHVKSGTEADKGFREILGSLPESERKKVKLDVEKMGDIAIHCLDVPASDLGEDFVKQFGSGSIYFAARQDAVFGALGDNALASLKEALQTKPRTSVPMRMELSLARFASLMKDQPMAPAAATKAFAEKGSDRIRMSLEGGKDLKIHLSVKTAVLRFFHLLEPQGAQ